MTAPTNPCFRLLVTPVVIALFAMLLGCHPPQAQFGNPQIATTTSYLEAAAYDLLGNDAPVLRLTEPGTCPGHFDMRPSQVRELQLCRALIRFDFQRSLDVKVARDNTSGPHVAEITLGGGLGRPESYLSACRQIANHLATLGLVARTDSETRLRLIAARLDALSHELTNRVSEAHLVGSPVISSRHQREFCEWLGLRVVATFRAADTSSIAEIEDAIDAGRLGQVKLVIANMPEGRRAADALAQRLKAQVVVFENFPPLQDGQVSFDAMLQTNVAALEAAVR